MAGGEQTEPSRSFGCRTLGGLVHQRVRVFTCVLAPLSRRIQRPYFLRAKFAKVDCSSLNFRPAHPEFPSCYPTKSTRLKFFPSFCDFRWTKCLLYIIVAFAKLDRPSTVSRRPLPSSFLANVQPSKLPTCKRDFTNSFPSTRFRTAVHDRNEPNSFTFIGLRTTLTATEGWDPHFPFSATVLGGSGVPLPG